MEKRENKEKKKERKIGSPILSVFLFIKLINSLKIKFSELFSEIL
jgi:hypothetical protein